MASVAATRTGAMSFWQKMALGLSAFILFGFAQFAARGFVDYGHVPIVFHLHGILMVSWLGLVVAQTFLVGRGNVALHRRLGWASVAMVPLIMVLGSVTCLTAIRTGIFPPFFTPGYFLALVHLGLLTFGLTVAAAIFLRGKPQWHRRLMIGSTIMLMEPALGRVLPMPLIAPWGGWAETAVQLAVMWLVVRHDRKTLGAVHPASMAIAAVILINHVLVEFLARVPAWQALASSMTPA